MFLHTTLKSSNFQPVVGRTQLYKYVRMRAGLVVVCAVEVVTMREFINIGTLPENPL